MKVTSATIAAFATAAAAVPGKRASIGCSSPVTLDPNSNPFQKYTLFANNFYKSEIEAAIPRMSSDLAAKARKVAQVGSFLWADSIANIARIEPAMEGIGCNEIFGLVVYDLPGRDCAAKASNGELMVGELNKYKGYVDQIAALIKKYNNVAFALVIEPDSLPNLVTNADLQTCRDAKDGYEQGVAYALRTLNLDNVAMYVDAGHGGWLGWDANLHPGAEELAKVYKAAGSPRHVHGFSTNVAGWNAWDLTPGEFSGTSDAKYNKCQNEKIYVETFGPLLVQNGMPGKAIVDTSRNAVQGLRAEWGDWCNVNGAGFGARPTSSTGSSYADAFVWVKPGGESDGTSDSSSARYDSFCGKSDAFKPSPEAGQWNEAYFEMLIKNAKPQF